MFAGMLGKALARQQLKQQMKRNAAKAAANAMNGAQRVRAGMNTMNGGASSGKYLFVAHPNCCPRCNALGATPHFFNTPDVAYITHPNCKCATIEVPAGLTPTEVMMWAKNPVGKMTFGWNYGQSLRSFNLTDANRNVKMADWHRRMSGVSKRMKVRAAVTQAQIDAVRKGVADGTIATKAKNLTGSLKRSATMEARKKLGKVKSSSGTRTGTKITQRKGQDFEKLLKTVSRMAGKKQKRGRK